ncbi:MAG: hypothetical protein JXA42_11120 [Anaerolineales bacterium]|nr:hypothetical protein [Anaerolineales bacterium]
MIDGALLRRGSPILNAQWSAGASVPRRLLYLRRLLLVRH